jgi:predicted ATP-dependent endonuclease of OLD family
MLAEFTAGVISYAAMIARVEARRFRSLRAIEQDLGSLRLLVGPNASGKTTFWDVIGFMSDLVLALRTPFMRLVLSDPGTISARRAAWSSGSSR